MSRKRDFIFAIAAALGGAAGAWSVSRYLKEKRFLLDELQAGSQMIATRFGPVETAVVGEGPAVLMLHGAGGGYDMSVLFANALPGFKFICVSRPGYLRTPLSVGSTLEQQVDAYADLLDQLGIEQAAVLGMSGGGPAAISFAARHPARCWAIVLVSAISKVLAFPRAVSNAIMRIPDAIDFVIWGITKMPYVPIVGGPSMAEQRRLPADTRKLLIALLMTIFPLSVRKAGIKQDLALVQKERAYPMDAIQAPGLVIHGEADAVVKIENAYHSIAGIPQVEQLIIPGGSHLVYGTHLEMISARLNDFLQRQAPDR